MIGHLKRHSPFNQLRLPISDQRMTHQDIPTAAGIRAAALAIDPVFTGSPLMHHAAADDALGLRLLVKVETLNPIRSFKGRGAHWWLTNLPQGTQPVVCASAGNFGQGVAYAARQQGRQAIVFASLHANPLKIAAMRRLGAQVIQAGADFDAAKTAARDHADQQGMIFVEDGADPRIAEGAGTIALEITAALAGNTALDAILVPLGNGALLTGVGAWMKAESTARVIGVVAEQAPAMKQSWESGTLVRTDTANTIADGIAVREPVQYALDTMKGVVDEVVAVDEASLRTAMEFCRRHYGLIVEPAGVAGVAALLSAPDRFAGQTVATILCGSNVSQDAD